jgi:hypothetical protein
LASSLGVGPVREGCVRAGEALPALAPHVSFRPTDTALGPTSGWGALKGDYYHRIMPQFDEYFVDVWSRGP